MKVKIKRAYEKPSTQDGMRILVDGLWPRGVSKADLKIAKWEKDIAPSKKLRSWYGHDSKKWMEFHKRYCEELGQSPRKDALGRLMVLAGKGNLTLVFGARDAEHSNAAVILEAIQTKAKSGRLTQAGASRHSDRAWR